MPDILLANARLAGLWLQLCATGAYVIYLPQCIPVLRAKLREGVSLWLPVACLLIFVITLMDQIIEMVIAYHAYSVHRPGELRHPLTVYANASTLSVLKGSATLALVIISDFIMVYRTFVVWNFIIPVMILPALLLLASIGLGIWSATSLSQTPFGQAPISAVVTVRARYFFALTFAFNVLCAGLISWKAWRVRSLSPNQASSVSDSPTPRAVQVIIETAAVYCAHLFILIISDSVGSNLFFLFLSPLPPIAALVFTMLIVRARGPKQDPSNATVSIPTHFWSIRTTARSRRDSRSQPPRTRTSGAGDIALEQVTPRTSEA
ncbi:hypothetical protein C8Q74DRAFT_1372011 [Fomes fomentarius]|nr:hypothetical protein C8Q74DRAFT_1372011 [Fomes fomentarius]